jgi:arylsulfatase A-like enzyme
MEVLDRAKSPSASNSDLYAGRRSPRRPAPSILGRLIRYNHGRMAFHSQLTRRSFASVLGAGALACSADRSLPNILWVTCEDIGPQLGAYGDTYADTPNLDKLAARGLIYRNAWSNAPVCAPARTTIISGLYPPSTGSEHMRSMTQLPAYMKMYPQFLREAGYYATNNAKEDYNLEKPGAVWDDSSNKGHWRNRKSGQPFFSIFNLGITHESQVRKRPHTLVHDPAKVRVPAYHPDTPEVRHDWAQYYDNITTMDKQAAGILRQLDNDGLSDSTIVFFYGDHGPGMPRCKRWPYNSGLQVPLIVHIPEKFKHLASSDYKPGGSTDRLVSFVDLPPTLMSLAGIKPPAYMQGHAFLGEFRKAEQPYIYGFRGRMDERYDMVRVVRDKRYIYIRNYMPHLIYGQYIDYMFQTPTTRVWKELYDQGKLKPPKTYFWEKKPPEELYDLGKDPDEVSNVADSAVYRTVLTRLREAHWEHTLEIRDVGFLPEDEIHSRSKGSTPYEVGHDDQPYPMKEIMATAELASSLEPGATAELLKALEDEDSAVRYWAAMGILMRGTSAVKTSRKMLHRALDDDSPSVRVIAARALGEYGDNRDLQRVLPLLLELARLDRHGVYVSMLSLNALDALGQKAAPLKADIKALPTKDPSVNPRMQTYVPRLIERILQNLEHGS